MMVTERFRLLQLLPEVLGCWILTAWS